MKRPTRSDHKKVEITPAMIEAGIDVLIEFEHFFSLGPTIEEILIRRILEASMKSPLKDDTAASKLR
jgi:hypothetical protein